jgi:membrane-bound lytic murein transglycosylase MltF
MSLPRSFARLLSGLLVSLFTLGAAQADPPAARQTAIPGGNDAEAFLRIADDVELGDMDAIRKHGFLRALVVVNRTDYFVDRGRQYGMAYELLTEFERTLNKDFPNKQRKYLPVVFIPVLRDEIFPRLRDGRGDVAVANLTVTPERQEFADFSIPFIRDTREILASSPSAPRITALEQLAGQHVMVRKSSSFYPRLQAYNRELNKRGHEPVLLEEAPEYLETEDVLEMLNADLIDHSFVDQHMGEAWAPVFKRVQLRADVRLAEGQQIAWALRKNTPQLRKLVDAFVRKNRQGTLTGNTLMKRYLQDNQWARSATSQQAMKSFNRTIAYFRKYGERYGFDPLLLAAQGFQESGLDQSRRSPKGAIGVMQVMPSTAQALKVGDIQKEDPNIHAGAKYMRQLIDRNFNEPELTDLNRALFAFAAYNAGPTKVQQLRREAGQRKLDPNQWFHNVETVASIRIGRETTQYVSNISKYYIAYRLLAERERASRDLEERKRAEEARQVRLVEVAAQPRP